MILPPLYAIVDDEFARAHGWTVPALARACLDGGAQLLQIRVKSAGAARVLSVCEEVAASTGEAALVVNDRADVARLVPGTGVHVGQDDLPPVLARRIVGPDVIVGLSTHTPAQVDAALREPITYLAVGPVFGTRTKETGYQAVGVDLVRYAADLARRHGAESGTAPTPVVAIGGITLDTARSVLEAGAASVAVVSDILATRDPASRVADLVAVLRG